MSNSDVIKKGPSRKTKSALGRGLGSLLGEPQNNSSMDEMRGRQPSAAPIPAVGAGTRLFVDPPVSEKEKVPNLGINKDETASNAMESRVWQIGIDQLIPNKKQPRREFDEKALEELSQSLKEQGMIQPILARKTEDKKFEIVAGERRWRAAQRAGFHEVSVIVRDLDLQNALELALVENIQRKDLNALEEAKAYQRLMSAYGLTQQQLAQKMGKDRATIANLVRLTQLHPDVQNLISKNELNVGQAKLLLGVEDLKDQLLLAKKIIRKGLSVRATEKLLRLYKAKSLGQNMNEATLDDIVGDIDVSKRLVKGLSDELRKLIGTKVNIDYNEGKGKLSVYFYSDEELNQYVDRLRNSWNQQKH